MENSLPIGWIEVPLEDCIEILDNFRIPVNSEERAKRKGDVPYYGATGQVGWIDSFLFDEELVLVGEDGAPFFDKTKNIAFIIKEKSWVNNHAHVIKAIKSLTSNSYVSYYLNSFDFTGFVHGMTRLKLTQEKLRKIPFPLAPLSEQMRIVAALDEYMESFQKAEKILAEIPPLLKEFRQKVLSEAVSGKLTVDWREKSKESTLVSKEEFERIRFEEYNKEIKDWDKKFRRIPNLPLIKILDNPDYVTSNWTTMTIESASIFIIDCLHSTPKFVEEGSYCIDTNCIERFKIVWENARFVDDNTFQDRISRLKPKAGDILFSREGTIGTVVYFKGEHDICLGQRMMMIRFASFLNPIFAQFFLASDFFINQYRPMIVGMAAQHLNIGDIRNLAITIPPIAEQIEIVSSLEALFNTANEIEAAYETAKAELKTLPQVLLSKAFKGELLPPSVSAAENGEQLLERIKIEKARLAMEKKIEKEQAVLTRSKTEKVEKITLFDQIESNFGQIDFTFKDLQKITKLPYEDLKTSVFTLLDPLDEKQTLFSSISSTLQMRFNDATKKLEFQLKENTVNDEVTTH